MDDKIFGGSGVHPHKRVNPDGPQTNAERQRRWRERQPPTEPNWSTLLRWTARGGAIPADVRQALAMPDRPEGPSTPAQSAEGTEQPESFDAQVQRLLEDLPAKAGERFRKRLDKLMQDLKADFQTQVQEEVTKRLVEQRASLAQQEEECEAIKLALHDRLRHITAVMTEAEYRFLKSCVHPDKNPASDSARFNKQNLRKSDFAGRQGVAKTVE